MKLGRLYTCYESAQKARRWELFTASVQGADHKKLGVPNEDAAAGWCSPDGERAIVAVADGHGSEEFVRAGRGAHLAAGAAVASGKIFLETIGADSRAMVNVLSGQKLLHEVRERWLAGIGEDLGGKPFTPGELAQVPDSRRRQLVAHPELAFGTTLILALVYPSGLIVAQVGDGNAMAVDRAGHVRQLVTAKEYDGEGTDSLCDPLAVSRAQIHADAGSGAPGCIVLSTDGWAKSYDDEAEFFKVAPALWQSLVQHGRESVEAELSEVLAETTTRGFRGDDITCGVLFNGAGSKSAKV